jgi:hypothetical protein
MMGFEPFVFTIVLCFAWLFLVPPISHGAGGPANDLFGIEVGNYWNYQGTYPGGTYEWRDEVAALDNDTFAFPTYRVDSYDNGFWYGSNWVEVAVAGLLEWGSYDGYDFWSYSNPLLVAWYPVTVNEERSSSADIDQYFSVSMTVKAMGTEEVDLGFDIFEAEKLYYTLTLTYEEPGNSFEDVYNYTYWIVPYIGKIKYQEGEATELLTSFGIFGGTVTEVTDTDDDCLKDYQELVFHGTDRQSVDTDGDNFSDFVEVGAGSDPMVASLVPAFLGDFDGDHDIDGDDLAEFAGNFGKAQCPCPCNGDFDGLSRVDKNDLAVFSQSFGKALAL